MKILICEDDIYLGNQICRYLQQKGYETAFCQSVQQVYEKLYEGIDLFLLDVHVHEDTTFWAQGNFQKHLFVLIQ